MGKSRPRPSADKLIIDRPELQTPRQRVLFSVATVAAWMMWFYLWLPLVTAVGWWFGIARFREVMIVEGGLAGLMSVIGWYAVVIAVMCGTLCIWACYNWYRFRNSKRRMIAPERVRRGELARRTRLPKDALVEAQGMRCMVVRHDKRGVVVGVEEKIVPQPPSTRQPSAADRLAA